MNKIPRYALILVASIIFAAPIIAQPADSLTQLYELRRQRSIERFGSRCEVNWNGLPRYCDDIALLNLGITADGDTNKAWQFIEVNRKILGVENPRKELEIDLHYSPYSLDDKPVRRIRFKQMINDFELVSHGYWLEFSENGMILVALSGQFIPEAGNFNLSNCMGEQDASRILVNRFGSDYHLAKVKKQIIFFDGEYQAYYIIGFENAPDRNMALNCVSGLLYNLDFLNRKPITDIEKILRSHKYYLGKQSQDGMPRFNSRDR